MPIVEQFISAADYWTGMVEHDYRKCLDNPGDLRRTLHCANALFHLHDWVYQTHDSAVRAAFTYPSGSGKAVAVSSPAEFANSLEQINADFGRIRGIANAFKHHTLRTIRPVANAPSHAANTRVVAAGGGFFGGLYSRGPRGERHRGVFLGPYNKRVVLEGPGGNDMEFPAIAKSVYEMWITLNATHHWW